MTKYRATKVKEDGYTFDSKRERAYYTVLKHSQKLRTIENLVVHPRFPIKWPVGDIKICTVVLDFQYWDLTYRVNRYVDVKGYDTPMSRLKRKLVEAAYGITVEVVK